MYDTSVGLLILMLAVLSGLIIWAYARPLGQAKPSQYMLVKRYYIKKIIPRSNGVTKVLTIDDDVVEVYDVVKPPKCYVLDCCTPNGVVLPIRSYVNWARVEMGLEPYPYVREPSPYQGFEQQTAAYEAHKYIADTLGEECK